MREILAAGVVAAVFALEEDARYVQLDNLCGLFGRQMPFQIHELAAAICETAPQFAHINVEQFRQLFGLLRFQRHVAGARPDRLHRGRNCQRLAIAIRDHAARRRQFDHTPVTGRALLLQEIVVKPLQIYRPACQQ